MADLESVARGCSSRLVFSERVLAVSSKHFPGAVSVWELGRRSGEVESIGASVPTTSSKPVEAHCVGTL